MTPTAELVQTLKRNSGHPLRELARRARTSASALVDYEAGRHEPKLSTLRRIAHAANCDLIVEIRPRLTQPERRSLELHRLIVEKMIADPSGDIVRQATNRIQVLRAADREGRSSKYLDAWNRLLAGHKEELQAMMLATSQEARELRQSSPFAGVLTEEERLGVIRKVLSNDLASDAARTA